MSGDRLNANADQYLQATALNPRPPAILSDPLPTGATPIEQVLQALFTAANADDPGDNADTAEDHGQRETKAADAAEKFSAQDRSAAAELNGIVTQQLPQAVAALTGMLSGALQPLTQAPQQFLQAAQQAVQTASGMIGPAAGTAFTDPGADGELPVGDIDSAADDLGDLAADGWTLGEDDTDGFGPSGAAGPVTASAVPSTAPAPMPTPTLGPPPVPSPATSPAAGPSARIGPTAGSGATPTGGPGLTGMPIIPPGAMNGTAGAGKDDNTATKRLSIPPVRNGAPVQGRIAAAPVGPAVTTRIEGAPAAARRIVVSRSDRREAEDDKTGA